MRVCFVGDIVGGAGRRAFKTVMPGFLRDNQIDCCIVNAENSVHGLGASINILRELENSGADLFTMGNHTFSNRDFLSQISKVKNVARPANFSPAWPGNDFCVFEKNGEKLGVFNLLGQVYANVLPDNPFSCADRIVDRLRMSRNAHRSFLISIVMQHPRSVRWVIILMEEYPVLPVLIPMFRQQMRLSFPAEPDILLTVA